MMPKLEELDLSTWALDEIRGIADRVLTVTYDEAERIVAATPACERLNRYLAHRAAAKTARDAGLPWSDVRRCIPAAPNQLVTRAARDAACAAMLIDNALVKIIDYESMCRAWVAGTRDAR